MPARVAFALSRHYTPHYEAVSREIALLRSSADPVIALLPLAGPPWRHRRRDAVLTAHPLALRLGGFAARTLRDAQLLHVFAPLPLPRRLHWLPAASVRGLTAISVPADFAASQVAAFDWIVAECERDRERLRAGGIAASRLHCIEPPATSFDLPAPNGPFRAGFASWPFRADEADARGLDLLAEAARRLPQLRLRIFGRPQSQVGRGLFAGLANVEWVDALQADAAAMWGEVHVALAPFRGDGKSKSAPNSIVEAIAAMRPAIVGPAVGLAREIQTQGAGIAIPDSAEALCAALHAIEADYERYRAGARALRDRFAPQRFVEAYRRLYGAGGSGKRT